MNNKLSEEKIKNINLEIVELQDKLSKQQEVERNLRNQLKELREKIQNSTDLKEKEDAIKEKIKIEEDVQSYVVKRREIEKLIQEKEEQLKTIKTILSQSTEAKKEEVIKENKNIKKSKGEMDLKILTEELKAKKEEILKRQEDLTKEEELVNNDRKDLIEKKKEISKTLASIKEEEHIIEEKISKIKEDINVVLSSEEKQKLVLQKNNLSQKRREIEQKRWEIEDKIQEIELKIGENNKILAELIKKEKIVEDLKKDVKEIEKRIADTKLKNKLELELTALLNKEKEYKDNIKYCTFEIEQSNKILKSINEKEVLLNEEIRMIEEKEKRETSLVHKRKLERERWDAEDRLQKIIGGKPGAERIILKRKEQLNRLNKEYEVLAKNIAKKEREIKEIDDSFNIRKDDSKTEKKIDVPEKEKEQNKEKEISASKIEKKIDVPEKEKEQNKEKEISASKTEKKIDVPEKEKEQNKEKEISASTVAKKDQPIEKNESAKMVEAVNSVKEEGQLGIQIDKTKIVKENAKQVFEPKEQLTNISEGKEQKDVRFNKVRTIKEKVEDANSAKEKGQLGIQIDKTKIVKENVKQVFEPKEQLTNISEEKDVQFNKVRTEESQFGIKRSLNSNIENGEVSHAYFTEIDRFPKSSSSQTRLIKLIIFIFFLLVLVVGFYFLPIENPITTKLHELIGMVEENVQEYPQEGGGE